MFLGAWCGQMSVGGWVLMGLLWVTFLGLVLWILSRLFVPPKSRGGLTADAEDLDRRSAAGPMDLSER